MVIAGGECGIPFYKRYKMPSEYLKLWYSFEIGPIHNLVFSTELDYSRGSEQFNFILNVSFCFWFTNFHQGVQGSTRYLLHSYVRSASDLIVLPEVRSHSKTS